MTSACPKFCSIYTSSAEAGGWCFLPRDAKLRTEGGSCRPSASGLCSSLSLYSAGCIRTGICVCIHSLF
ncbi:hypothetical protein JMJ77_0010955 [Colletotrichum scovillei]|uniref:Uncharacterized protein n=1 Tax=Colletotrichum scovillei TaxID=1209932 RepID=A0A9P7R2J7_9PEZI|nr:hypothetical protein JMJ77_0010955 [Colletotrichum scovillei]KAG7059921.1 hypothetical protein JMJ78_0015206 [Colletotrichum scovillei]KAG7067373.1 hypothetical protein JMJ76_0008812 [Colletotrichum scovillei]